MWLSLFSPLSFFICSAVVAAIVYFIFHSLMNTEQEQEIGCTATGKLSRRLGFFERYFLTIATDTNVCHVNTVLLLNSTVKLDPDHVKKALFMLLQRFPLLRMRVTVDEFKQPCFEEMENPQSLDFRSMVDVNSDDWQYVFEKQEASKVHDRIDSGKHLDFLKLLQSVDIPSVWALWCYEVEHGLQKEIFNLTNLGALSIDEEGKSPYKFAGSYLAVQSAQVCYIFCHNIFTINGRLYWTGEYSPENTTRSQAEEFVDLSLRILMGACAS